MQKHIQRKEIKDLPLMKVLMNERPLEVLLMKSYSLPTLGVVPVSKLVRISVILLRIPCCFHTMKMSHYYIPIPINISKEPLIQSVCWLGMGGPCDGFGI